MGNIKENRRRSRWKRQPGLGPVRLFDDEICGGNPGPLGENAFQRGTPGDITLAVLFKMIPARASAFRGAKNSAGTRAIECRGIDLEDRDGATNKSDPFPPLHASPVRPGVGNKWALRSPG
jgi:hypothetical protein